MAQDVFVEGAADPHAALRQALRDEFYLYPPESAPYDTLNAADWVPVPDPAAAVADIR